MHAELLCGQCTVAPTYPMSEERAHKTSRFSYAIYMTISQFLGNQSNTQPIFKSLSVIDQYLKLKAFFFQRLPLGRLE